MRKMGPVAAAIALTLAAVGSWDESRKLSEPSLIGSSSSLNGGADPSS